MQKAVPFSTNSLKLESPGDPHAAAFIAQRRRRVEKAAQSVSPVYKAKTGSSPGGATQRLPRETLMCRASGARQQLSTFPSPDPHPNAPAPRAMGTPVYALGYLLGAPTDAVRGGSLHPDSPEASYSCNPTLVFGPMRGS